MQDTMCGELDRMYNFHETCIYFQCMMNLLGCDPIVSQGASTFIVQNNNDCIKYALKCITRKYRSW
jgi:hypothetical protein